MAVDEALLDRAIHHGEAALRFYEWVEPTLSLGYFQEHGDRVGHPASSRLPCVRRHTGGGAIVHDRELTYCLALPAAGLPQAGAEACYELVHHQVAEVLRRLLPGCPQLSLSRGRSPGARAGEPWLCFQRRSRGDLVAAVGRRQSLSRRAGRPEPDYKLAGSAQRKRRGAVLQHGSLLLSTSDAAPELPGVLELGFGATSDTGKDAWRRLGEALRRPLADAIAGELAADLKPADVPATVAEQAKRIAERRFAAESWTRRR